MSRTLRILPVLLLAATLAGPGLQAAPGSRSANVSDFGAKGDGVADDSAAIQKAIDSIQEGTVTMPDGIYRITRTLNLHAGLALQGSSIRGTVIEVPTELNITAIRMSGGGPPSTLARMNIRHQKAIARNSAAVLMEGGDGKFLKELWLSGFQQGVDLVKTGDFWIDSVVSEYCATSFEFEDPSYGKVVNCLSFFHNNLGFYVHASVNSEKTVVFVNCSARGDGQASRTGMKIVGLGEAQMQNVSISQGVFVGGGDGIVLDHARAVSISDTRIDQFSGNGLVARGCQDLALSLRLSRCTGADAMKFEASNSGVVIRDTTITGCAGNGVNLGCGASISGLQVRGWGAAGSPVVADIQNPSAVLQIQGCRFEGSGKEGAAVRIVRAGNSVVQSNVASGCSRLLDKPAAGNHQVSGNIGQ